MIFSAFFAISAVNGKQSSLIIKEKEKFCDFFWFGLTSKGSVFIGQ